MYNMFLRSVQKLNTDELEDAFIMTLGFRKEVLEDSILRRHHTRFFGGIPLKENPTRKEKEEAVAKFINNYLNFYSELSTKMYKLKGSSYYYIDENFLDTRAKQYEKFGVVDALREELGLKSIVVKGQVVPPEKKVYKFKLMIRGTDTETIEAPLTGEQEQWLFKNYTTKNAYNKFYEKFKSADTGAISSQGVFAANFMISIKRANMTILMDMLGFFGPAEILKAYEFRKKRGDYSHSKNEGIITDLFGYNYTDGEQDRVFDFILDGLTPDQRELAEEYYNNAKFQGVFTQDVDVDTGDKSLQGKFEEVEGFDPFAEPDNKEEYKYKRMSRRQRLKAKNANKKPKKKRLSRGQRKYNRSLKAELRREEND